ncbi:MAG: 23S rRNA (pseudouridine(1915)-N(3))-methyltransferase RlmH [Thermoleophilia bacterium]|nr:23S rRNA (pseudouridine(1915)-N(3))-methyltransferase RlmH [Thermoleophilia bacterium]
MQVQLARLDLIVVGAPGATYAAACADYERRLSRYVRSEVHEVKGEPLQRGDAAVLAAEGERITKVLDRLVPPGRGMGATAATIAICDPRGEQLTSEQLTERLLSASHLVLIIGGACGIAPDVDARARTSISFGRITMPHQLARVVATEQLYRAFRIARNEPYHH